MPQAQYKKKKKKKKKKNKNNVQHQPPTTTTATTTSSYWLEITCYMPQALYSAGQDHLHRGCARDPDLFLRSWPSIQSSSSSTATFFTRLRAAARGGTRTPCLLGFAAGAGVAASDAQLGLLAMGSTSATGATSSQEAIEAVSACSTHSHG